MRCHHQSTTTIAVVVVVVVLSVHARHAINQLCATMSILAAIQDTQTKQMMKLTAIRSLQHSASSWWIGGWWYAMGGYLVEDGLKVAKRQEPWRLARRLMHNVVLHSPLHTTNISATSGATTHVTTGKRSRDTNMRRVTALQRETSFAFAFLRDVFAQSIIGPMPSAARLA